MNALKKQLKNDLENYVIKHNKKIETVFIGGGTPSTIKAFEYEEIFEMIKPYLEEFAEITTGNDRERSTRANGNKPKVV